MPRRKRKKKDEDDQSELAVSVSQLAVQAFRNQTQTASMDWSFQHFGKHQSILGWGQIPKLTWADLNWFSSVRRRLTQLISADWIWIGWGVLHGYVKKIQVRYSAVNHEKSLYNYFIPCHRKFRWESLARDASWECWMIYRRIHNGFPASWLTAFSMAWYNWEGTTFDPGPQCCFETFR